MTDKDDVKPFRAKEVASGQEAAEADAAVLKHAQERDQAAQKKTAPKPQPRWLLPLGINLAVFAAYLLIWSPDWVVINRIAPPPAEAQLRNVRAGVYMAVSKIESFRQREGRLPGSLDEAGVPGEGLDYTLIGQNNYSLVIFIGEEQVSFNSATEDLEAWGERFAADFSERLGG